MAEVPPYTVRGMRENEILKGINVWIQLGKVELVCEETVRTWYQIDPDGFYVAVTDEGEVLGMCAGVVQPDHLVFIGMFGVKPQYQKRGIGTKLWKAVIDYVGDRNAALYSARAEISNYKKSRGMSIEAPWGFLFYTSSTIHSDDLVTNIPGIEVRKLTPSDPMLSELIRFDESVCGFPRSKLVTLSLMEKKCVFMVAIKNKGENYQMEEEYVVCGFGCLKTNIGGAALVSPLYADGSSIAELLLHHLIEAFPLAKERGISLGVKSDNEEAKKIAEKLGLERESEAFPCLFKKLEIQPDGSKIYGLQDISFTTF